MQTIIKRVYRVLISGFEHVDFRDMKEAYSYACKWLGIALSDRVTHMRKLADGIPIKLGRNQISVIIHPFVGDYADRIILTESFKKGILGDLERGDVSVQGFVDGDDDFKEYCEAAVALFAEYYSHIPRVRLVDCFYSAWASINYSSQSGVFDSAKKVYEAAKGKKVQIDIGMLDDDSFCYRIQHIDGRFVERYGIRCGEDAEREAIKAAGRMQLAEFNVTCEGVFLYA